MNDLVYKLSSFIVGAINSVLAMFDIEPIVLDENSEGFLKAVIDAIIAA